jgi:hypothetical protein
MTSNLKDRRRKLYLEGFIPIFSTPQRPAENIFKFSRGNQKNKPLRSKKLAD